MRVLILDDDADLLDSLSVAVANEGLEVVALNRGHDAVMLIRSDEPIDLFLLDVGLPDVDGWTVAKFARKFRPGVPIYMFTGWSVMKKRAGRVDVNGILHKPMELDKLLEILRRHHRPSRAARRANS